jgi:uncharacterized repeat protein (TIGR01451 family)
VIYYDHWEDELEENLTSPVQASTLVWGDGDLTNGIAPTRRSNPDDILLAGDVIPLRNRVVLEDDGSRDRTQIFFDGGDALTSLNGAIAVTLAVWPESLPIPGGGQIDGILYAGAWELIATSNWGTDYRIPVGEDLAPEEAPPGSPSREGFRVVGLNVTAVEDGTTVQLDLDSDGDFETTRTLNRGEQLTRIGDQNGIGSQSVLVGAWVLASAPVQVHVFTADHTASWEARAYTMLAFDSLADEWLAPRASDGDFWLYNPDDSELAVAVETSIAPSEVITIPAESTIKYPASGLSGPTGVYFASTDGRPFDGVVALSESEDQDWGYPLLPVDLLTDLALVGWAPGNNNDPPGPGNGGDGLESRVYVTALEDTTVFVDYDQDGTVDFAPSVSRLEEVSIVDFANPNYDMTGAVLYTTDGTNFIAVWGQDQSANPNLPSIDVGTAIVPLATIGVQKTITLIDDADGSGDISWGDTIRFQIYTVNNTTQVLVSAVISDTLPPTVDYVPDSSTVRGEPISDDDPPNTLFPFDEDGYPVGDLLPTEVVLGTFDAVVKDDVEEICNTASADTPSAPPPDDATACVSVVPPITTPTPTPTPTATPKPPEEKETPEPTPLPPPPPSPTPTATPVILATPTLPVLYLPETGTRDAEASPVHWDLLLLLGVSLAILAVGSKVIRKERK